jgi:hypothetical protein
VSDIASELTDGPDARNGKDDAVVTSSGVHRIADNPFIRNLL